MEYTFREYLRKKEELFLKVLEEMPDIFTTSDFIVKAVEMGSKDICTESFQYVGKDGWVEIGGGWPCQVSDRCRRWLKAKATKDKLVMQRMPNKILWIKPEE